MLVAVLLLRLRREHAHADAAFDVVHLLRDVLLDARLLVLEVDVGEDHVRR